ncbi:MAG TPA: methyl-accepting chemotaxis protein [Spirochaetota bacterium]|nr:methyl-accepting chemotaxis protein [Spirochaetota bacterium]
MGILGFGIVLSLSLGMALIRTIRDKIELIVSSVNRMGTGDFSENRKVTPVIDELSGANSTLYDMKEQVAGMFSDIIKASDVLTRSTDDISTITETFSSDTQNQAATVEEVSATIEEVSASMDTISSGTTDQIKSLTVLTERIQELAQIINESEVKASESKKMSQLISTYARSGEASLSRMDSNMQYISKSSEQMRAIISMINDISEQINLLSLNASIEAARAGSAGMGFAVVADEVSKLAESTATSVKEIDTLIKKSDSEISEGKQYVLEVINEMKKIIDGVANIAEMAGMISGYTIRQVESYKMVDDELRKVKEKSENIEIATAEQKRAMAEIVESTSRINELTQSISSGAEEIAASSGDIAKMAASQKEMTTRFKIREV